MPRDYTVIVDRDGTLLPEHALSSTGELYAEVAKADRMVSLAYRLLERAGLWTRFAWHLPAWQFRSQMCERAEERRAEAYDRYHARCSGIRVVEVRYYSNHPEAEGQAFEYVL